MFMDMIFYLFFGLMILGGGVAVIYLALWAMLHKLLPSRLDPLLFRKPWFQPSELSSYRVFPLSLIRSLNYSYLIAFPGMAKQKRFRGMDFDLPVNPGVKILCRVHISSGFAGAALGLAYLLTGLFVLAFL